MMLQQPVGQLPAHQSLVGPIDGRRVVMLSDCVMPSGNQSLPELTPRSEVRNQLTGLVLAPTNELILLTRGGGPGADSDRPVHLIVQQTKEEPNMNRQPDADPFPFRASATA